MDSYGEVHMIVIHRTGRGRRTLVGLVAAFAVALGLSVFAGSASAAASAAPSSVHPNTLCTTHFIVDGVRIHSKASLSSTTVGLGYSGQKFVADDLVSGSGGVPFLLGTDTATGVHGYVEADKGFFNINECP
ncbi:MAG: hypothetical protein WCA46_08375 [Actinocatenispora sp.]